MIKPEKKLQAPAYDWSECEEYIKEKYGINISNYSNWKPGSDVEFQNFWHWMIDVCEIRNGCYFEIDFRDFYENDDSLKDWQKTILKIFIDEFQEGEEDGVRFWVEW